MMRAIPTASLRSVLLICIFKAAFACLASIQITGSPSLLSSVHSHVTVGPVSSPIRSICKACELMNSAIASGSDETTPSPSIFPVRSTMQIAVSFSATSSRTYHSIPALHDCKASEEASSLPRELIPSAWGCGSDPELPHVCKPHDQDP